MSSNLAHAEVYSIQHYGDILWVLQFPAPIKTDHHDITEILLNMVLNTSNTYSVLMTD